MSGTPANKRRPCSWPRATTLIGSAPRVCSRPSVGATPSPPAAERRTGTASTEVATVRPTPPFGASCSAPWLRPAHPRLRRQADCRRQDQGRDHALPQAVRRPRDLRRTTPRSPQLTVGASVLHPTATPLLSRGSACLQALGAAAREVAVSSHVRCRTVVLMTVSRQHGLSRAGYGETLKAAHARE
jgi:hypothetical protein